MIYPLYLEYKTPDHGPLDFFFKCCIKSFRNENKKYFFPIIDRLKTLYQETLSSLHNMGIKTKSSD